MKILEFNSNSRVQNTQKDVKVKNSSEVAVLETRTCKTQRVQKKKGNHFGQSG